MDFNGETVRELREKRGLTVGDMVFELRQIGLTVTNQTVYNWESGSEPKASALLFLSRFFKVKPDRFFDQRKEAVNGR